MRASEWLLLGTCAFSLYGMGQVWLVQQSSYRLWAYVGDREFRAYHLAWWHSIWGVILAPAAILTIGSVLMLWWRAPGVPAWATWFGLGLQAALFLGTAIWWGPLMARVEAPNGGLARTLPTADEDPLASRRHRLDMRRACTMDVSAKCVADLSTFLNVAVKRSTCSPRNDSYDGETGPCRDDLWRRAFRPFTTSRRVHSCDLVPERSEPVAAVSKPND